MESMFSILLTLFVGLLTTTMNSYSALGPNFSVIRLVSSLEIGFSIYHASCLNSEFTMFSFDYYVVVVELYFFVSKEVGD